MHTFIKSEYRYWHQNCFSDASNQQTFLRDANYHAARSTRVYLRWQTDEFVPRGIDF
jgi:hypothetical protein